MSAIKDVCLQIKYFISKTFLDEFNCCLTLFGNDLEHEKYAIFDVFLQNFGKRHENNSRVIFDLWSKVHLNSNLEWALVWVFAHKTIQLYYVRTLWTPKTVPSDDIKCTSVCA